jgi:uncharacterized damage-inducible protein DinB
VTSGVVIEGEIILTAEANGFPMTKAQFTQLFAYDAWANARVLKGLRSMPNDHARARALIAHVHAAQLVWMTRLREHDASGIALFPDHTLDQCAAWFEHNHEAFTRYLDALEEDRLDESVTYVNSQGASFSTPIREILTHVANHGTYHRGQIAMLMRDAGHTPPVTDFIAYVRHASA